ncbi:MAG: hypothetical protein N6V49_00905 [Serratia symbiotica]|nr:hypothetical protein [Serratia symbiotica]
MLCAVWCKGIDLIPLNLLHTLYLRSAAYPTGVQPLQLCKKLPTKNS